MGAIRGDLSVLSVANLLQALVLDRSEGLLTVESGADQRVVRVMPTGIRLMRGSSRCHRLERLLRRMDGFARQPQDEFSARVSKLVRDWMLEEICELFTWSRGTFVFQKLDVGQALDAGPFAAFGADCDVTEVAIEAARWADELPRIKGIIRDLRQVPVTLDGPSSLADSRHDPEAFEDVLRLVDGIRPVIQILQLSLFPRFIVLQILYSLVQEGALSMKSPDELPGRASVLPSAA